ncbi:hypothetical protein WOLCODRAFT_158053 [Wolfiporia cocos MD-104 SS10]|uniref:Uncharacterized protein n=1 Tax=Wolfiporia cocos (strain MD-104) TaxID=742152 RepID=A0A2H3J522_WOLCO|nr:hypothetical protein WOLCODRAFT_158053 [Wolfiporia cocos MD-104 SS10]
MDQLRKAIGDNLGLSRVESESLNLWKPNEELLDEPGNEARTAWDERKRAADYHLNAVATKLHSRQAVGSALQLNTGRELVHVIVELPEREFYLSHLVAIMTTFYW